MVALIDAFRALHLAQQCIHFRESEPAIRAYGSMAGQGRKNLVLRLGATISARAAGKFRKNLADERRRVAACEERGNRRDLHLVRGAPHEAYPVTDTDA